MSLDYFPAWQYLLVALGFLSLVSSIISFREENKLHISLGFFLLGSLCIHWFAISIDSFLNVWDEQYHALVARNCMLHPLRPTFFENPFYPADYRAWVANHVWLHKQPLFLWQMALSMKIFGINEIALRIPNFIMMSVGSLLVFRIGQLSAGAKTGLYGACIFTTLYFITQLSSGAVPTDHNDVAFLFYVTATLWAWTEYSSSGRQKWIWIIGLLAGCAVLNKWLTGLLIYGVWGITILFYDRPFSLKKFIPLLKSLLLAVIIFLPWQIFCAINYPLEFHWERELNTQHFFESIEGHTGTDWFHFEQLGILYNLFVPYLIVPGFIFLSKNNKNAKITTGLITGVVLIYLFFTLAKTKMPAFTFPVAGIMCIALGALFVSLETTIVRISKWLYIPFIILFCAFLYFNMDMNTVQRMHGISKSYPLKNYYSAHRLHEALFIKDVAKKFDLKKKPVIFNVPFHDRAMFMFYSGATCYEFMPSRIDVSNLISQDREIYVLAKEKLEDYLELHPSVHKITYPENTEVSRRKVSFKFSNNKFLCCEQHGDHNLVVNRDTPGEWETFTLIQYQDSSVTILASNNKYLSVDLHTDQKILLGPEKALEWERFKIEKLANGKSVLKDCNNNYVLLKDNLYLKGGHRTFSREAEMEIFNAPE